MPRQIYKQRRGYRRNKEYIREKKTKRGEFQELRKIIFNLSVFLATILRWLV